MALIVADRVKEVTTTTGTGAYTLGGAVDGFQAFSAVTVDTDTVYYAITDDTDWEVGIGTIGGTQTTLARTTILSSSNSDSAVNWGAGAKNIFLTYPAEKAVYEDISGNVDVPNNLTVGGTVDGVDIAARDAVLTSTTTTANAALPKAGGTMTGAIAMGTFKITGAGDPTNAQDLATKTYVDTVAATGLNYHAPVRVETATNRPATYNNGTSGVGATLTNSGTQAALVIDGVTVDVADRILIQNQTDATQNGVYTVTNTGSVSTNWVLTRATDADSYAPADPDALGEGDAFFVSAGDTSAGNLYVMNTSGVITFGTTNITFTLIAETAVYSAGTGMALTGTVFSIGQDVGTGDSPSFVNVTAGLTGNASTATALATGRTISLTGDVTGTSASFNGTGNVSIAATIAANSVALGTDTTGNYVATGAVSGTGLSGSSSSEGGTFTVTSNATALNTASTIVARDGSGNFAAGTVTAALSGNSTTATALATGRTIGMTGDVVWTSASFDGSGNVTGTATIQANSVALGTDTTGNYVQSVANGSYLTGGGAASEGAALTLGVDAASINTASKVVARDASGNFAAGTITAALTGNASTATTLQTARTIGGVSFNGAANINLPGVNTAGNQNTSGNAATATTAVTTSGNAGSATVLQTARTVALSGAATGTATSFNGSANITIPVTSLNAPNLSGVVPNASISGSYTGMTNLTGSGTVDFAKFLGNAADTALLPSFSWTGDTNTGIYQPAADQMGFSTAGVLRLTLSTTALTSTLNIAAPTFSGSGASLTSLNGSNITTGTVAAARVATLNQNTTGSSGSTTGNAATATALQTARTINGVSFNGTANITVADSTKAPTASPTFTGTVTSPTFNASSTTNGGFQGIDADTALLPSFTWTSDQNTGMWHAAADAIGFTTAGVNRITINSAGISGAGAGLTGLNGSNISTGTVAAARVATLNQSTTGNATTATRFQTARTINGVSFNGTANITVADSTKAPTASPTFTGTVSSPTFNATSVTSGGFQGIDADTITAPSFTWTSDLDTGMWHAGVNQIGFSTGGVNRFTIDASGNVTATGNVTAYSDVRLKSNIQTIESGLDKVCAMRGVTFEKDGAAGLGVIAQEVEQVIPEVVFTDAEGMKSVAYANLVGVLIEAIKELKDKVESLEAQLREK